MNKLIIATLSAAMLAASFQVGAQQTAPTPSTEARPRVPPLLTQEERNQFREKMRAAKTRDERAAIQKEMRALTEQRAKEKGITLPQRREPGQGAGPRGGMPGDVAPYFADEVLDHHAIRRIELVFRVAQAEHRSFGLDAQLLDAFQLGQFFVFGQPGEMSGIGQQNLGQELAADNDLHVKQLALEQLVGRAGVKPWPLAQPVALPFVRHGDGEFAGHAIGVGRVARDADDLLGAVLT